MLSIRAFATPRQIVSTRAGEVMICRMRYIEIDLAKPDFQSIRAATELLADGYTIVFPGDKGPIRLSSFKGDLPPQGAELIVAEDFDVKSFETREIVIRMPEHTPNRAFHTLVQLADGPLIAEPTSGNEDELEYGFCEMRR